MARLTIVTSPSDGRHRVIDGSGAAKAVFEPHEYRLAEDYARGETATTARRPAAVEDAGRGSPADDPLFAPRRAPPPAARAEEAPEARGGPEGPAMDDAGVRRRMAMGQPFVHHDRGWWVWDPGAQAWLGRGPSVGYGSREEAQARYTQVLERLAGRRLTRHLGASAPREQVAMFGAAETAQPIGGLFATRRNDHGPTWPNGRRAAARVPSFVDRGHGIGRHSFNDSVIGDDGRFRKVRQVFVTDVYGDVTAVYDLDTGASRDFRTGGPAPWSLAQVREVVSRDLEQYGLAWGDPYGTIYDNTFFGLYYGRRPKWVSAAEWERKKYLSTSPTPSTDGATMANGAGSEGRAVWYRGRNPRYHGPQPPGHLYGALPNDARAARRAPPPLHLFRP